MMSAFARTVFQQHFLCLAENMFPKNDPEVSGSGRGPSPTQSGTNSDQTSEKAEIRNSYNKSYKSHYQTPDQPPWRPIMLLLYLFVR